MQKWEYLFCTIHSNSSNGYDVYYENGSELEKELDLSIYVKQKGEEGWELVSENIEIVQNMNTKYFVDSYPCPERKNFKEYFDEKMLSLNNSLLSHDNWEIVGTWAHETYMIGTDYLVIIFSSKVVESIRIRRQVYKRPIN